VRTGRTSCSEYWVAVHEAGHVVAGLACGRAVSRATIDPEVAGPGNSGAVWGMPDDYDCKPLLEFSDVSLRELRGSLLDGRPLSRRTCVLIYAMTIEFVAGTEAERLLLPDRYPGVGATDDMKTATYFSSLFTDPAAFR
jgi:hypothetical protein